MRRRFGLPVPLEVRYDEFTFDIAENRILRAATERLLALPQLPLLVRRSLRRLLRALAEVSRLPRGLPPPSWRETRLNARYVVRAPARRGRPRRAVVRAAPRGPKISGFLFDLAPGLRGLRVRGVA